MRKLGYAVLGIIGFVAFTGTVGYLFDWSRGDLPKMQNASIENPRRLLIVGEVWPPFEYSENGKTVGINKDVFDYVFGRLGIPFELRFYPWSRAKMMAEEGAADMVTSVSYLEERESWLHYSDTQRKLSHTDEWPEDYLWKSEYVFFCRKNFADKIRFESYAQIKRDAYRVGTIRDYSYNPAFRAAGLATHVAPDIMEGFRHLAAGGYDLLPSDITVGMATIKSLGLTGDLTYIERPIFTKPYLLVFCRKSQWPNKTEVIRNFYRELDVLRKNGEYEKIRQKYVN